MTRLADVVFSVLGLLVLLPLFIVVVPLLRLTGEGKVFYYQTRVGANEREFNLIKFATMLENSPNMLTGDLTVPGDPRVLPVGAILRKTKINELPQLINVLRGDMSLVGPRPLTPRNYGLYSKSTRDVISQMRPGLSGVGSLILRDEESLLAGNDNPLEFYSTVISPYKAELECWYAEHQSFALYLRIITATAISVCFPSVSGETLVGNLPPAPKNLYDQRGN